MALAVGAAVADQRHSTPAAAISWTQPETGAVVAAVLEDVRIAIDNLLRNAVTAASEQAGTVSVSLRRDGAFFELLVTNPGQLPVWLANGEDEALLGSTKPGGLGLGLSISRQLIADGGGELTITQQGRMVEARLRLLAAEAA
jgi:signal transduction histidine kinase